MGSTLRFTKPITMKYYIALLFVVAYKKSCSASICKSTYNLWSCTNATATFNEENYEKHFGTAGFSGTPTPLALQFKNDENVQKVVFNTNGDFAISMIKGPNVEEIELSGKMLTIPTLCPFLRTKKDLPKLRKVSLTNIGIKNFKANQDCGNDSLTTHLQTTIPMKVEILIQNATINVTKSPDNYLIFARLYNLKSLTMKKVELDGVDGVLAFDNSAIGKKQFADAVTFSDNPNCECYTEEDSNELKCPSDPNNPKCETTEEPQPQTGNTAILNIAKWINIAILTLVVLFY